MATIDTLIDAFNGTTLNSNLWSVSAGSATVGNGNLSLLSTSTSTIASVATYDLTNSSIVVAFNNFSANALQGFDVRLYVNQGGVDYALQYGINQGIGSWFAEYGTSGTGTVVSTGNTSWPIYLRISEHAGTIIFDTSANGTGYTITTTVPTNSLAFSITSLQVLLRSFEGTGTDTAQVSQVGIVPAPTITNISSLSGISSIIF